MKRGVAKAAPRFFLTHPHTKSTFAEGAHVYGWGTFYIILPQYNAAAYDDDILHNVLPQQGKIIRQVHKGLMRKKYKGCKRKTHMGEHQDEHQFHVTAQYKHNA